MQSSSSSRSLSSGMRPDRDRERGDAGLSAVRCPWYSVIGVWEIHVVPLATDGVSRRPAILTPHSDASSPGQIGFLLPGH